METLTARRQRIAQEVAGYTAQLVVVSKTQSVDTIKRYYDTGQRHFGENRVHELLAKRPALPTDISWHLIGHLQRNKVKYIVPFVALIHSVDSIDLLLEIEKVAQQNDRKIDVLLQFKIAGEATKYGFDLTQLNMLIDRLAAQEFLFTRVRGVMGMASFIDDMELVRDEFRRLNQCYEVLKNELYADAPYFDQRSMGMSGDYRIALEEGSTMVRIGSMLF